VDPRHAKVAGMRQTCVAIFSFRLDSPHLTDTHLF
jgi:hypothetical protein